MLRVETIQSVSVSMSSLPSVQMSLNAVDRAAIAIAIRNSGALMLHGNVLRVHIIARSRIERRFITSFLATLSTCSSSKY